MRTSELEQAVGGLSKPSKTPGLSYGIPAAAWKVGSILRRKKGTVCEKCYAHKGMYVFPAVQNAQRKRLEILSSNLPAWTENMITLLERKYARKVGDAKVFRWHDSGDIQSREHLEAIVAIAKALPGIRFWLPTKEYALIRAWILENNSFPSNLTVRVSAPVVGAAPAHIPGTVSSTVASGSGYACPSREQGNACGDCRACWNKSVESVDYHAH